MSAKPYFEKKVVISNALGIHARPASMIVKTANQFKSDIFLVKNSEVVNGKSIMGIMILAAGKGSEVLIRAEGEDCERAVMALVELIDGKFGEEK